jgi:hypothetical protein
MFSTISGNLLLARSKPRNTNYIGFWYSFGTARFENRRGEPLSETENLRRCLKDLSIEFDARWRPTASAPLTSLILVME